MSANIDINDLPARLDEVKQLSPGDEIVITSGDAPVARLVPLNGEGSVQMKPRSRLADPFAGDFTEEDVRLAKEALASDRPRFTTEQVKALIRAFAKQ